MLDADYSRSVKLDYLREYPLGEHKLAKEVKNITLTLGTVPGMPNRIEFFNQDTFCWRHARQLEQRQDVSELEGVWPINYWRCNRRFGNPGSDVFNYDAPLSSVTAETYALAKEMRTLGYFRATNSAEARQIINHRREVRYATEITSEWYDPPDGIISITDECPTILGSHAVPLLRTSHLPEERFWFPNSWGCDWGRDGWGSITFEHFDKYMIEAWFGFGPGLFVPMTLKHGIVCLEWKWSLSDSIGVHCREIVDAHTSERLAWAFCKKRSHFLDVEEFYVWPSERGKKYGKELARMVTALGKAARLPLRMLISYADTESDNLKNAQKAADLLGLKPCQSGERWAHWIATSSPGEDCPNDYRPKRPAFLLELLRPKDEKPIIDPINYCVYFGTNRRPIQNQNELSADRDNMLHLGKAHITIPVSHRFGCKGRTWTRLRNWIVGSQSNLCDTDARQTVFGNTDMFYTEIKQVYKDIEDGNHNLLYIHGFNVSFRTACDQAAQFGVDLKVRGCTFLFSWPSIGSIRAYMADEAAVEASLPYFRQYLRHILDATGDDPLSIICHSMGSRLIVRLIEDAVNDPKLFPQDRVRNVIFAAPDVDTQVFQNVIKTAGEARPRGTLYQTRADYALLLSEIAHSSPRAGLAPPVVVVPETATILVEGFDLFQLGHNYIARAAAVLHDMFILLHHGSKPDRRPGLSMCHTNSNDPYWTLRIH